MTPRAKCITGFSTAMISIGSERLNVYGKENVRQPNHQLVHGNTLPPTSPGSGPERPARLRIVV